MVTHVKSVHAPRKELVFWICHKKNILKSWTKIFLLIFSICLTCFAEASTSKGSSLTLWKCHAHFPISICNRCRFSGQWCRSWSSKAWMSWLHVHMTQSMGWRPLSSQGIWRRPSTSPTACVQAPCGESLQTSVVISWSVQSYLVRVIKRMTSYLNTFKFVCFSCQKAV